MAAVTLDQSFKEELQHVDQWFCYLSDAERTATIYTLLQHSTPVQTRFFMNILQQQKKRDSVMTLSEPGKRKKEERKAKKAHPLARPFSVSTSRE
ncbi:hypothetical protein DM01DRAFT_1283691 [Hesseltinella vesiculosa]|uniref:RNA-binding protein vts1-like alpha-helical domain-containing protein n=1 Tax=Hesseltinella vesiculosa TaxID=101127 RepID=A0A1X2GNQ8_9FUNG|nr:hypothetical protein DM01DRAFT_1283691 [Hesseltinella vesiculosa]